MDDTMAACNEALQRAVELRETKPKMETVNGKIEETNDREENAGEPKATVDFGQGIQTTRQDGGRTGPDVCGASATGYRAGLPGLALDEVAHEYTLHGAHVPGVTDVIEEAGICDTSWFTDEVADRGHRVHIAIAMYNQGRLTLPLHANGDDGPKSITSYLTAYAKFLSDSQAIVVASEQLVYNSTYEYAGTLDLRVRLNGKNALIDVKSGVALLSHPIQTAAYEACLVERCDRYCLYLKPNGDYKLEPNNDPEDFSVFLLALSAYRLNRWKQQRGLC